MEKNIPIQLQEIICTTSDISVNKQIIALEKINKIRKIAPKIYTPNFEDDAAVIVKKNILTILGKLYSNSILSHRSALEFKPTETGDIFVTYSYTKKIKLPGIVIHFLEGKEAIDGDNILTGGMYVAQLERALLENMQVARQRDSKSKIVSLTQIEERLEQVIKVKGEDGLKELRDTAKIIADKLEMQNEFAKLTKIISALLQTQPAKLLHSPIALARAFGHPYDTERIALFENLFIALQQQIFNNLPEQNKSTKAFKNMAFFEAYFSNYIEGTEFEIEDAKKIIATEMPMLNRDEDSHDVLGTYKLVSNKVEMKTIPTTADELLKILLYRHKILMSARTSKKPGSFKDKNNRAGETHFVDMNLVKGTLIKGYDFYQALSNSFARATYMMFLISEVHPFLDGNGRTARVMMNAELVAKGQAKIIIPTVYREDYMLALRKLTRQHEPAAYIKMLLKAHKYSATIIGDNMDAMQQLLESSNAFKPHDEAKLRFAL